MLAAFHSLRLVGIDCRGLDYFDIVAPQAALVGLGSDVDVRHVLGVGEDLALTNDLLSPLAFAVDVGQNCLSMELPKASSSEMTISTPPTKMGAATLR